MRCSVVILSFTLILHRATCQGALKSIDRRQLLNDQLQCLHDQLQNEVSSDCLASADEVLKIDLSTLTFQEIQDIFNQGFRYFCVPECGNPILAAYEKYGTFAGTPDVLEFFAGLCGTNENKEVCYEDYVDGITLYNMEASCYRQFQQSQVCNSSCENQLSAGVEDLGCCIDVFQDFFTALAGVETNGVYEECGVNLPKGCNNSTVSTSSFNGSVAVVFNIAGLITALGFSVSLGWSDTC